MDKEVRHSICAQLLLGTSLEGIVNEIGEILFDKWTLGKLDRCDTALKRKMISSIGSEEPFEPDEEPLLTIKDLAQVRNRIARHSGPEVGAGNTRRLEYRIKIVK